MVWDSLAKFLSLVQDIIALVNSCIPETTNFKRYTRTEPKRLRFAWAWFVLCIMALGRALGYGRLSTTQFFCTHARRYCGQNLLKQMKKVFLFLPIICFSCARRIGDLNMIATRNIDSKTEYVEIKRYAVGKSKNIQEAVDKIMRDTPGGEFLKNVVIYSNGKVEGDVWGIAGMKSEKEKKRELAENRDSINRANKLMTRATIEAEKKRALEEKKAQFNAGDRISYTTHTRKVVLGEIIGKDEHYAIIKNDLGAIVKIRYQVITKIK